MILNESLKYLLIFVCCQSIINQLNIKQKANVHDSILDYEDRTFTTPTLLFVDLQAKNICSQPEERERTGDGGDE